MRELLTASNGFYAFESALHVLPSGESAEHMTLQQWNSATLWRDTYGELAEGCDFFAEDIFGDQFCFKNDRIFRFDAETGETKHLANSVEEWCEKLLRDWSEITGHRLAHEWQACHGALHPGVRLVPRTAFVLGGEYSLSNLLATDAIKGMRARGAIARQLRGLPNGTRIQFNVVD
ncbi:MAG TPA: SMI1/KNR4 family protein [Myxococcales bacterium]